MATPGAGARHADGAKDADLARPFKHSRQIDDTDTAVIETVCSVAHHKRRSQYPIARNRARQAGFRLLPNSPGLQRAAATSLQV
jgi:hypothetical protein